MLEQLKKLEEVLRGQSTPTAKKTVGDAIEAAKLFREYSGDLARTARAVQRTLDDTHALVVIGLRLMVDQSAIEPLPARIPVPEDSTIRRSPPPGYPDCSCVI